MKKKSATAKLSLQQLLIRALEDLKAQNIVTLDVRKLTDVTDTLIIASGTSSRQVRAIAENAMEEAKKHGFPVMGVEGLDAGDWVLADFVDVVVHVMLPETREFYDLERLWQSPEEDVIATATETRKASPERKFTQAKPASKRSFTEESPVFDSQHATARARKKTGKSTTTARKTATGKSVIEKPGVAKAGVYAKTGTRKPAAAKSATPASSKKKSATVAKTGATKSTATKSAAAKSATPQKAGAAKTPATKTSRSAIGISTSAKNKSNTTKPKKPAARKPRAS